MAGKRESPGPKQGRRRAGTLIVRLARGPRRQCKSGSPGRLSHHKGRAVWFQARACWPVREAPVGEVVRQRARTAKTVPEAPGTAKWESIGPSNIGGRLTCIVADPTNADRIWVGAAGGGVWHSTDGGQTWQVQWDRQDVLNVGSLAIDPSDPSTIYCGTGEANLSADSYPGVGIYKTKDSGKTWQLLAKAEGGDVPRRIGVVAIDPFDRKHILIGGIGFGEMSRGKDLGGLYVSTDAAVKWRRETFVSTANYWCHSVVFHPTVRGTIFASFTERGSRSGIYRSQDGGAKWEQLTKGLPEPARVGRASLAISLSSPEVLYAFARDEQSGQADRVLGVFRTEDGGDSWSNVAGNHFRAEGQISYGNTFAVHPKNPDHVICGGVDLHVSTDGGKNWRKATKWNANRGDSNYAHADHHGLLMPPTEPGRIYDPNDGGLDVSPDGGKTWTNRSNGLSVTMFYDMDVAQSDPRVFGGGAQDNGTVVATSGRADDFFELLGGDGGWIVFDPADPNHVYASYYNLNIYRFLAGKTKDVSPPATKSEQDSVWMAFIDADPRDPKTVFTGSGRVWRTTTDGKSWTPISAVLDGSAISAIEVAPADPRRIYVGTEHGGLFRSVDGGDTWSPDISGSTLPGHTITRLATGPADAQLLFATVANFGHSHVFRSRDGGTRWEDIDRGRLPDVPHNAVAIRPDDPAILYVCNDVGVFVSPDAGDSWANLTRNLPHVMVVDLVYRRADRTLHAATYGRSLWRLFLG